jgi:tetratricopeptide (TPR) repeat protein
VPLPFCPWYREALAISRAAFGEEHENVAIGLTNLANALAEQQEFDDAETLHREALAIFRRFRNEEHEYVTDALNNVAGMLERQGRYEEAESLCSRILSRPQANEYDKAGASSTLGAIRAGQKRFGEAQVLLSDGFDVIKVHRDIATPRKRLALRRLLQLYDSWDAAEPGKGYAEKAAEYRALLTPAAATSP